MICEICKTPFEFDPPAAVDMAVERNLYYCANCSLDEKPMTHEESQKHLKEVERQRRLKCQEHCLLCGKTPIGYVIDLEYGNFGWCQDHTRLLERWEQRQGGGDTLFG